MPSYDVTPETQAEYMRGILDARNAKTMQEVYDNMQRSKHWKDVPYWDGFYQESCCLLDAMDPS